MPAVPPTCPRCQSRMEEGFLLDRGDADHKHALQWVEGEPERSFWFGLKTRGRELLRVTSYRCDRCGYLESYARE